ncbi:MAG: Ig-like domain-containing protein [Granulosicoccus sp.]
MQSYLSLLAVLSISLPLSGCGWVDATGKQTIDPIVVSDGDIQLLGSGRSLVLEEDFQRLSVFEGKAGQIHGWNWQMQGQANPERCRNIGGFNTRLAASTLANACTQPEDCHLQINETEINGSTGFQLSFPELKAPVATSWLLSAVDQTGETIEVLQTICGISTNEAPLANDDQYIVRRGHERRVKSDDPDNLLANDSDDDDVQNQQLSVNPVAIEAPRYAALFKLYPDGGFLYQPAENTPTNEQGNIQDRFVYAVTDGMHTVTATATIQIVEGNRAPQQSSALSSVDLVLYSDAANAVNLDLSYAFADPDGDNLTYRITGGYLPWSNSLELSADGRLAGTISADDIGSWYINMQVSDGIDELNLGFWLYIYQQTLDNSEPIVYDISNRLVHGSFHYNVAPFFDDPDGDELNFSAVGLPAAVTISRRGVISGRSKNSNRGAWLIRVTADDNRGGQASDSFRLTIN